jgi:hypothetical protein
LTQHLISQHTQQKQALQQHAGCLASYQRQWMGAAVDHAAQLLPRQPQRCIHSLQAQQHVSASSSSTALQQQAARHSYHALAGLQGISSISSSSSSSNSISSSISSSARAYHAQRSTGGLFGECVAAAAAMSAASLVK